MPLHLLLLALQRKQNKALLLTNEKTLPNVHTRVNY